MDKLKEVIQEFQEDSQAANPFIQLMEEALVETLEIIFPEPFEA